VGLLLYVEETSGQRRNALATIVVYNKATEKWFAGVQHLFTILSPQGYIVNTRGVG